MPHPFPLFCGRVGGRESSCSIQLRVQLLKPRRLLVSARKRRQLRVLVKPAKERNRNRRARPANVVVVAVVDRRRRGRVRSAQSIGQNHRRIARQVRRDQLRIGRRRHDDVHLLEELRKPAAPPACARGWPGCTRPPDRSARSRKSFGQSSGPCSVSSLSRPLMVRSSNAAAASAVSSGTIASHGSLGSSTGIRFTPIARSLSSAACS